MKSNKRMILFYLFFIVAIVVAATAFSNSGNTKKVKYSDITEYFYNEEVKEVVVNQNDVLILTLKNGYSVEYQFSNLSLTMFVNEMQPLIVEQQKAGIITSVDYLPATTLPWWVSFLPYVLVIVVLIIFWWSFIKRLFLRRMCTCCPSVPVDFVTWIFFPPVFSSRYLHSCPAGNSIRYVACSTPC